MSQLRCRRARPGRAALALLAGLGLGLAAACHEVHFEPRENSREIQIHDDLFAVSVVDAEHVVAAGYWGSIYTSFDGGESWQKGRTPTEDLLYDVSMADAEHGWAVGQLGLILRTEDGGRTWTRQESGKGERGTHLFGVHALDSRHAWTVGTWGTRLYTHDGGETWQDRSLVIDQEHPQFVWLSPDEQERVRSGEKVFEDVGLNDVSCLDSNPEHCWIIGEFGYIFHSDDGGRSWERGEILSGRKIEPVTFGYDEYELSDEAIQRIRNFAESIADQAHINISIDPRISRREFEELGPEDLEEDPFPLFELIEARAQSAKNAIVEAGLLSDRIRQEGPPPWDYEAYLEDDPRYLERYFEGRISEEPMVRLDLAQSPYLFTVRFQSEESGMIAGLGGVVLRTEDGGETWRYLDVGRKQAVFSIAPLEERILTVGEKGLVRVSTDGGETWSTPARGFPEIFTFMRDIQFTGDGRVGYIVGQRGLVLRSTDGGGSWSQVLPPESESGEGADQVAQAD